MKIRLLFLFTLYIINAVNAQIKISDVQPNRFSILKEQLFFTGYKERLGKELWKSDGTQAGTSLVKDIFSGANDSAFWYYNIDAVELKNDIYFLASDSESGRELWKTDGTETGTKKITHFINGNVSKITLVGNQIFFLVQPAGQSIQVWKSDGTENGTVLVKSDIQSSSRASFEGKAGNTFIFTAGTTGNVKVWRSDGTSDGTFPITEEIDGNGSGNDGGYGGTSLLSQYIEHNQKLYFVSRFYIYETDGTIINTRKTPYNISDIGESTIRHSDVIAINNKLYFLYFSVETSTLIIQEMESNLSGLKQIYYKRGVNYFSPSNLADYNGNLIFTTGNDSGGTSLAYLDLLNYSLNYLKEIAPPRQKPAFFDFILTVNRISKIDDNFYFTTSAMTDDYMQTGWITTPSKTENLPVLDNIMFFTSYKNDLYYSKNGFWKFDKNLLSTKEIEKVEINIYPNPIADEINFKLNGSETVQSVTILDSSGKTILTTPYKTKIALPSLIPGIYFVKLKLKDSEILKKIIKK